MSRNSQGLLLCGTAALGWGAMPVFAILAYHHGVSVLTLLALRFPIAALLLWLMFGQQSATRGTPRDRWLGFLIGFVIYSVQAASFYAALTQISASLATLLLHVYPASVALGAWMLRIEEPSRARMTVLILALAGVALVVGGGLPNGIKVAGVALSFAAALAYTSYLLCSDRLLERGGISPPALGLWVMVGASAAVLPTAVLSSQLRLPGSGMAWLWVGATAVFATALPVATMFAGLKRLGPGRASVVQVLEPVVTVSLSRLVFGDALGLLQAVGAVLVIGAVVVPSGSRATAHPEAAPA